ncbi:ComEC/Rec2 family competence protein [Polaribacter sp. IC073]|uniref:ComEC/Rec2 family competence protein n=1 Tax=Polaribacter sp. IC073 TaxID=2508540 RepID=UPI001679D9C6|nr:ComEC/Rec2 family competence protein [Polaribacter sp. IC073]
MKRLLKYVPLHFLVFLILGIGIQFYTQIWTFSFLKLFAVIAILIVFLFVLRKKKGTTFIAFIVYLFIGISAVYIQDARNYQNHYNNFSKQEAKVVLRISKVLKPGFYYEKYVGEVVQLNEEETRGEILLNIQKDSLNLRLKIDDKLFVNPVFKSLIPPLNPHQFDYKSYLAKQGIHHQIFLENSQFLKLSNTSFSLIGISEKFRDKIQESLLKYNFKNDEFAVISALLLGQRQDISKGLLADYANAGAIHILAVSGLHVGIILLILSFLFKPLEILKNGAYLKAFCIVLFLWMFAFIAGLSASVVRAVTMFTFLAIGQSFQRKKVVEFSLISSMLFLLIVKPMFLFDVGFQLSYLAVFGIVWVQPKLAAIYKPRFLLDKKIWQLFTVSIAAQVGILPLSIYYFQQFPGLFVLSNLIIIPFLGAVLIGGILIICMSLLNILPQFLADIYGFIISLMNGFVSWISQQEQFLFKEIAIPFLMMLGCYFFIFSGILFLIDKKIKKLLYFIMSILVLQGVYFYENKTSKEQEAFIVFHKSRFSVIGKRKGTKLEIQHDLDTVKTKEIKAVKSYRIAEYIQHLQKTDFKNYLNFNEQDVLIIDSLGIYQLNNLKTPIVVLQYSPKINLARLIKTLNPSFIIADGSNYKSSVTKWEITSIREEIPFHYTGQKGAFSLKQ